MKPRDKKQQAAARPDPFEPAEDGFGAGTFPTAGGGRTAPGDSVAEAIRAIEAEGLTARQLRLARRSAQKHDLTPISDHDAVRLLRAKGVDPFLPTTLLELVPKPDETANPAAAARGDAPKPARPVAVPPPEVRVEQGHAADILRIQADIRRRRRRKVIALAARLLLFVGLPTLIAGYYYYAMATPLYATRSEMVIQQADAAPSAGGASGLGGMLGGAMEANKDSIAVQGYLQSREAMQRLDAELGLRRTFSDPSVDVVQRLGPDATDEDLYRLYQRNLKIAYDPTEGLIKMEVLATTPEKSVDFSRALIRYAEEQIDHLTQRKREDQMTGATASLKDAEAKLAEAQARLVALQERHNVLSGEVEVGLVTAQIGALQTQLTQETLSLEQMRSNPSPNRARMEPVERRIAALQTQIADLRAGLTQDDATGRSLAQVQGELLMAQSDVATRQLMLSTAMAQMESARIEANRQVRYLSLAVSPVAADEPGHPRSFENTVVTMLIFSGIYLMVSMTVAILREQVTA
jgi:capsular polysaccharide transport system permease protein